VYGHDFIDLVIIIELKLAYVLNLMNLCNNAYNPIPLFHIPMTKMQKKNLDTSPDETRTFENGKIELATLGDVKIGRAVLEPSWSWENCVKPLVKTDSCQAPHTQYIVSVLGAY
jgi:hypothetical protein